MPRAVVFDLGGVLIHWDPRLLYRKLLPSEDAIERFLATVCTRAWNEQLDAGRRLEDGLTERIERFPQHEPLIRAWGERFPEMLLPIHGSIALLDELAAREVPLYALSNWAAETWQQARPLFPFLERFDGIVISGLVGLMKPDPRIFAHLLETHALDPREVVFVDDSGANVAAAARLGIASLRFEGPARLRAELAARGLL